MSISVIPVVIDNHIGVLNEQSRDYTVTTVQYVTYVVIFIEYSVNNSEYNPSRYTLFT